jgi:hypothetical protein
MNIKYQIELKDNPSIEFGGAAQTLKPISLEEIISLEQEYNNGHQFPVALRELLFLAGNYCYVLEYGLNDSQYEMQEWVRSSLPDYRKDLVINRPFFIIDTYNGPGQFLFIYLDEGDDPMVYEALLYEDPSRWTHPVGSNLTKFIESGIWKLKQGYNPF